MVRLDVNKILARARRAEKKFEKFDKEFKQEHQELPKTFFKKTAENTVKQLPKKLLAYEQHSFFQKFYRRSFVLLKNIVVVIGSAFGFLFGKIGSGLRYFFGLFVSLLNYFSGLFKRKKVLPTPAPKPTVSVKPVKQTWSLVKPEMFNKKSVLGIVGIVLTLIFVPWLVYQSGLTDCANDVACFGSLANECKQAKYTGTIAGATVSVVARDCQLTKTIVSLPETEPESIRLLFVGKSMKCQYALGNFDKVYLEKLTGNLQTCSGELVDAIQTVAIG